MERQSLTLSRNMIDGQLLFFWKPCEPFSPNPLHLHQKQLLVCEFWCTSSSFLERNHLVKKLAICKSFNDFWRIVFQYGFFFNQVVIQSFIHSFIHSFILFNQTYLSLVTYLVQHLLPSQLWLQTFIHSFIHSIKDIHSSLVTCATSAAIAAMTTIIHSFIHSLFIHLFN